MKNIKNILVPIDFSVTSRDAYRYAVNLAESLNAKLTVIHVIQNLVMVSDVMIAPFPLVDHGQIMRDTEQLILEEGSTKNKVDIEILEGDVVDVLTELSKSDKTDLIVIGTTGLSDVLTKIFGSVSTKLSNKAHCPVILVPRGAKWQAIEQMMYASNYDSVTPGTVKQITDFATNIDADIHFVNVKSYDPVFEIKEKELDWKNLFTEVNSNLYFETHTLYGNNTEEELKKYSESKNINLIAFVSKHRNFWESLLHHSITQNAAISTTIPMMVIHLDDETSN
jgi:nucleotide-binding universal stress UspA family protein